MEGVEIEIIKGTNLFLSSSSSLRQLFTNCIDVWLYQKF